MHCLRRLPALLGACLMTLALAEGFVITEQMLDNIGRQYGADAKQRVLAWDALMKQAANLTEVEKLERVNAFFNRLRFVSDADHWGRIDYWATPLEMLSTDGGDCEDFSIAKYFTLKAMGVPESRMRLTYVKALTLNQAHMVVTYFLSPESDPLVLDNLIDEIRNSTQRNDLYPIYSFNGEGLWLAKARGTGKRVGASDRISLWQDLIDRINHENRPSLDAPAPE
jgi:predicted transglutaminase-like cysteine proteinase